jgi:aquaporin Z
MTLRSSAEPATAGPGRTVTIDSVLARKAAAELLGTALLVFFGAGMDTIAFGFRAFGSSIAAGIIVEGLTFGLILIGLMVLIGPISGGHVNPAVTLGALLNKRIALAEAAGYWVAQIVGGILGALLLLWVMHSSPFYVKSRIGLGANGWGPPASLLHASGWGAFLIEIILTTTFVMVVLAATRKEAPRAAAAGVIGLALALVVMAGIAVDGASVNPARSLGPAIIVGGQALNQVWLFLVAPLIGAALAAGIYLLLYPLALGSAAGPGWLRRQPAAGSYSAADERLPSDTSADTDPPVSGTTDETNPVNRPDSGA